MAALVRVSAAASAVRRNKFAFLALALQIVFIVLFSLFGTYSDDVQLQKNVVDAKPYTFNGNHFAVFGDVSLFLVIGFGLFCGLLRRYQYSSIAYNLLLIALVFQWGILTCEFFNHRGQSFTIGYHSFLRADFAVVAVLVSFGAVLGKLSPVQLLVMGVVETVVYAINCYIGHMLFQAVDGGRGMFVHLFGAYFGLAVSRALHQTHFVDHPQDSRTYSSDVLTFIGSLFFFVFFKSFNSALVPESLWERVAVNTDLAIVAAVFGCFIATALFGEGRFNMVHLQNSVIAGGVSIACVCHWFIRPYTALWVGLLAGFLCVFSFVKIQPCLLRRCNVHDTRGVHSSHGVPALLGVIISLIYAAVINFESYGESMYVIFPAMVPNANTTDVGVQGLVRSGLITYGQGRTPAGQVLYQFLAAIVTLAIALFSGFITGFLLRFDFFEPVNADSAFDDRDYWATSEELLPEYRTYVPPVVVEEEGTKEAGETVALTTKVVEDEQQES